MIFKGSLDCGSRNMIYSMIAASLAILSGFILVYLHFNDMFSIFAMI